MIADIFSFPNMKMEAMRPNETLRNFLLAAQPLSAVHNPS